jgi:hypothetical protein
MQSNGGVMAPATARKQPIRTMESGPVSGVIAASQLSRPPGAGPVLVALLQFLGEWNDLLTALPFPPRQARTSGLTMGADQ